MWIKNTGLKYARDLTARALLSFSSLILVASITLALYSSIAEAATASAYAEVEPRSGTLDDVYTFKIIVENGQADSEPQIMESQDFQIQKSGTESGMSIVNGSVSMRHSYFYTLTALKTGLLYTPKATITVDGQEIEIEARKIEVRDANKTQNDFESRNNDAELYMTQSVDKNKVYLGEQIVNNFDLFVASSVAEVEPLSSPSNLFWQELIQAEKSGNKVVNGTHYRTLSVSYAIFPLKTGQITLEPRSRKLKVQSRIRSRSGLPGLDPFDDPFFGNITSYKASQVKSNAVEIEVMPLPERPANFKDWNLINTIVGKTELNSSYDSSSIEVGQSKTINFKLTSLGNLNPIKEIPINSNTNFKVYQDTPQIKNFTNNSNLISQSIFSVSIVPIKPGVLEIPEIELGYYDNEESTYKVTRTGKITFAVTGQANQQQSLSDSETTNIVASSSESTLSKDQAQSNSNASSNINQSWINRISKLLEHNLSLALAAFTLLSLIAIATFSILIFKFSRSNRERRALLEEISLAKDCSELQRSLLKLLRYNFEISNNSSREELLKFVSTELNDSALDLELQILMDKLDNLQFSLKKAESEEIMKLKDEIITFASKL